MVKRLFKLCYRVHVADLKESPAPWATLPPWSLEILTGPCSQKAHSQSFLMHRKIIHHQRLDMSRNSGPFSPDRPFSQLGGTGLYCKHGVSAPQVKGPIRFVYAFIWWSGASPPVSAQFLTLSWGQQPCHALGVLGRHFTSTTRAVMIVHKIKRSQIISKLVFTP